MEEAMTGIDFMREALAEARLAAEAGELPVGCVIVRDGSIIARAHNECEALRDATAHAEVLAIRRASATSGDWRLQRCTLYVTLEPCPMCAGAILQARVGRLVYGAADPGQGCAGSLYRICEDPAFPHFCPSDGGLLAEECAALLNRFFEKARRLDKPRW
jgi:tRNA(adenine34) deaminase